MVCHNGDIQRAIVNSKQTVFNESEWVKITNNQKFTINDWAANTQYSASDIVVYNNKLYRANENNNDSNFIENKWTALSSANSSANASVNVWMSNTEYDVGNIVAYNDGIYIAKVQSNDSTFDENKWKRINEQSIKNVSFDWKKNNAYIVGDIVVYKNEIYRNIANAINDDSFIASKYQKLTNTQDATLKD